jgi:hypothetical protein
MIITIKDIYDLRCAILRTLYPGRVDCSELIQLYSYGTEIEEYLCLDSNGTQIILGNDNTVRVCYVDDCKPLMFIHSNITNTLETIVNELAAKRGRTE